MQSTAGPPRLSPSRPWQTQPYHRRLAIETSETRRMLSVADLLHTLDDTSRHVSIEAVNLHKSHA